MNNRWSATLGAGVLGLTAAVIPGSVSAQAPAVGGYLRLVAAADHVTAMRYGEDDPNVYVNLGVYVAAIDRTVEFRVHRDDYTQPLAATVTETSTSGSRTRDVPADIINSWNGLRAFAELTVWNESGEIVIDSEIDFCPNSYEKQRLSITGPDRDTYPSGCNGNPLARGGIWGIPSGWATPIGAGSWFGQGIAMELPDGEYTAEVVLRRAVTDFLGVRGRTATVDFTVETIIEEPPIEEPPIVIDDPIMTPAPPTEPISPASLSPLARSAGVAEIAPPPPAPVPESLPDLASIPAYGIDVTRDDETGQDLLGFGADTWNAGPAPLVIDGFRNLRSTGTMAAYQTFYSDDTAIGYEQIGTMEYHEGGGHDHWHFLDFAAYELTDENQEVLQRSGKQAWCLAPTDAIDLSVPNAQFSPGSDGLNTACGTYNPGALWIREALPVGWGDTYTQFVSGQAFDITDLPNGTYFIKVIANPAGRIREVTADNNVAYREVILGGVPGERTVEVPPIGDIDTEGFLPFGFGSDVSGGHPLPFGTPLSEYPEADVVR